MRKWAALVLAGLMGFGAGVAEGQAPEGPLGVLDGLVGRWQGSGTGVATELGYRWVIEGHVLEVSNEVRGAEGEVLARYHGMYAWDGGRGELVFLTAGSGGEVHRGRAWWRGGVLWHEAEVSGGGVAAYASAVRLVGRRLEYFADYARGTATPALLGGEPIVYEAVTSPVGFTGRPGPVAGWAPGSGDGSARPAGQVRDRAIQSGSASETGRARRHRDGLHLGAIPGFAAGPIRTAIQR